MLSEWDDHFNQGNSTNMQEVEITRDCVVLFLVMQYVNVDYSLTKVAPPHIHYWNRVIKESCENSSWFASMYPRYFLDTSALFTLGDFSRHC